MSWKQKTLVETRKGCITSFCKRCSQTSNFWNTAGRDRSLGMASMKFPCTWTSYKWIDFFSFMAYQESKMNATTLFNVLCCLQNYENLDGLCEAPGWYAQMASIGGAGRCLCLMMHWTWNDASSWNVSLGSLQNERPFCCTLHLLTT